MIDIFLFGDLKDFNKKAHMMGMCAVAFSKESKCIVWVLQMSITRNLG